MLFDARAHEPLLDAEWRPAEVEAAIRSIARGADEALRDGDWWPWHPLDLEDGDPDVVHGVYLGAAGVVWALHQLAEAGLHEPRHDYAQLARDVLESYLRRPEFDGPLPSVWLGEGGITLVAWLLSPTRALADRLAEIVAVELEDDPLELIEGSSGLLLIADEMLERTGEPRWASASSAIAERLMLRWREEIIGPAHGLTGVVAALVRRHPSAELSERATVALAATVVREAELANWPPSREEPLAKDDGSIRTQWCHGAPGVVASTAGLPADDRLDSLLLGGGELTWAAGPLRKGAGLCHGTAGNGLALLKLFTRTGDESWLERARCFAMHSAAQVATARREHGRGRYTLWTGDLGTAFYLHQCLAGTSDVPTIDTW
jgi:lantibiotic modifying enzyme